MESDEEDLEKITKFINEQKSNHQTEVQIEFQDFVDYYVEDDLSDQEDPLLLKNVDTKSNAWDDCEDIAFESNPQVSYDALTEEEREVIENCTDPDLQRLLILNRQRHVQILILQSKIAEVIEQCEQSEQEMSRLYQNFRQTNARTQSVALYRLAAPYFKDSGFFPAPLNADALRRKTHGEITVYDISKPNKWSYLEFDRLISAVRCIYNVNRQKAVVRQSGCLKLKEPEAVEQIAELEQELEDLQTDTSLPALHSNEHIDWYKVAETFLKDKRTPEECKSAWHILIHPDINKSDWSDEENQRLQTIAKAHKYQNWDAIAEELDTKRTGFTACLHYFSKLSSKFLRTRFTPEEDKKLLEVVSLCKIGNHIPWNKVVYHFSRRSRHQLFFHYTYFLSQQHVKKGKFTEAEDILLMVLVEKFGRNFRKCSQYMPNRSQMQIKNRYNSNLQRDIKKGSFSEEEDRMILEHVETNGPTKWCALTTKINRCSAQIRQRYRFIQTYLKANPNAKVTDAPKRKNAQHRKYQDRFNYMMTIVKQYEKVDFIPTLQMIEENLELGGFGINIEQEPDDGNPRKKARTVVSKNIDDRLTEFFSASLNAPTRKLPGDVEAAVTDVREALSILGVKLEIPPFFECDMNLDEVDREILTRLIEGPPVEASAIEQLIPPNVSNLVGLKTLILKHKEYKGRQKRKNLPSTSKPSNIMWSIEQNLLKMNENEQSDLLHHRALYSSRFDALFRWSAVLSLQDPNGGECDEMMSDVESFDEEESVDDPEFKTENIGEDIEALDRILKANMKSDVFDSDMN